MVSNHFSFLLNLVLKFLYLFKNIRPSQFVARFLHIRGRLKGKSAIGDSGRIMWKLKECFFFGNTLSILVCPPFSLLCPHRSETDVVSSPHPNAVAAAAAATALITDNRSETVTGEMNVFQGKTRRKGESFARARKTDLSTR